MERVQQASLRLADRTGVGVGELWDLRSGFVVAASLLVAQANTTAVTLADAGVTAELVRQTGRPALPLGLAPTPVQVDRRRIGEALERIIDEDIDSADTAADLNASRRARLVRFGSDETLLTVASATHEAVKARQPPGWVRVTDPDPCHLCRGWNDGIVRGPQIRMIRHRGCACIAQPVFT